MTENQIQRENVDAFYIFELCIINTMRERKLLRDAGYTIYIELLIDGISVTYPSILKMKEKHQTLLRTVIGKVMDIMWSNCKITSMCKVSNDLTERIFHVMANWDLKWRELQ